MKKNIREELLKFKELNLSDSSAAIAKQLVAEYDRNNFLNQKELAKKAFTSESMITYFAKRMGYSGYRELITMMKAEKEFYNIDEPLNIENGSDEISNFRREFDNTLDKIDKQYDQIKKIINLLNFKKRIFIFSSYEQTNNAESFFNILELQGKNVFFSRYRKSNGYYTNEINKNDIAFFVVSGLDNLSLVQYYEKMKNKNITVVVIASSSQAIKFKNPDAKVIIQSSDRTEIYQTARNAHMNYLFNMILLQIK